MNPVRVHQFSDLAKRGRMAASMVRDPTFDPTREEIAGQLETMATALELLVIRVQAQELRTTIALRKRRS